MPNVTQAEIDAATKQITILALTACPKYKDDGSKQTDPAFYNLGVIATGGVIAQALRAGKTAEQIAAAVIKRFKSYKTLDIAPGPGGPGGQSYGLAWNLGTQEFSDTAIATALGLDPKKPGTPGTKPTGTPETVSIGNTTDVNEVLRRLGLVPPVDPAGYPFSNLADWTSRLKDQRANAYRNAVESQAWNDIDPNVVKFLFTSGFASDNGPGVRGTAAKTYQGPVTPEEVHGMDISAMVAYFYPETGQPSGKP